MAMNWKLIAGGSAVLVAGLVISARSIPVTPSKAGEILSTKIEASPTRTIVPGTAQPDPTAGYLWGARAIWSLFGGG